MFSDVLGSTHERAVRPPKEFELYSSYCDTYCDYMAFKEEEAGPGPPTQARERDLLKITQQLVAQLRFLYRQAQPSIYFFIFPQLGMLWNPCLQL